MRTDHKKSLVEQIAAKLNEKVAEFPETNGVEAVAITARTLRLQLARNDFGYRLYSRPHEGYEVILHVDRFID